jgi:glycosyltransferase involved in cell wall biosynthesis
MQARVLIDGYFLGKPYGFGRFIFELCRALGQAETELDFIVATPSRVAIDTLPHYPRLRGPQVQDANFILWEQVTMPRLARRLSCDVIHFPYNTRALATGGIPAVTTVHDLIFLHDSAPAGSYKDRVVALYTKAMFRLATRRSACVVSVSETTGRALGQHGIASRTVYNTVDGFVAACTPAGAPSAAIPMARRYVLHRGGTAEHRNTGRVIAAFIAARPGLGDVTLKIVGAPGGREIWRVGAEDGVEFLPRISDAALGALYAGSACVVAASLAEGFGLPIIEAFGFGAPVITSRLDPLQGSTSSAALPATSCIGSSREVLTGAPKPKASMIGRPKPSARLAATTQALPA